MINCGIFGRRERETEGDTKIYDKTQTAETRIGAFCGAVGAPAVRCAPSAASDSALPALTVGSDTYPPYVYMDNNGDITGLDVEIAEEAFRRMGYRAEFTTIDWEKKTELVDSGEIDCIWDCFSMEGRENDYQWAGPYLVSRQVVAVDAQSGHRDDE